MNRLRKSAISCIVVEMLVLQFLHPILDGRGFLSETAARKILSKSHRRVFARLVQCEIPLSLVSLEFLCREMVRVILLNQKVCEERILPESMTPRLAETQVMFALALSTWKFRSEYK